jgi:multidrug efflux pump subunit AcrA (membrane-fusion protein)
MKTNKKSLRGPIFAVAFLLAVFLAVRWFVVTKRGPGSMTVVEAQAMDMTAMKAPIGVFPVGTDHALVRRVGGTETFPATVVALSDEDVVARVDGLLQEVLVYPGDRVKRGQLLARLQADELSSQALAESLAAQAMDSSARRATQSLSQQKSAERRAEFEVESAKAAIESAKSELAAAAADVEVSREMVEESEALRKEAAAQLTYARIDYDREKKLHEAGAVSRDSLDQAKRNLDEAQAKVDQAEAKKRRTQSELAAVTAKRNSAANMVKQSESMYRAAVASLEEARAGVLGATEEAAAMRSQAASARANARSTGTLSSYTELRATDEGVVTERLVSPGTPVMAGETVLKLKADRELRIQAELPQRLASSVTVGSTVRATVNEASLDAKVTSVFPYIEGSTRSFRIEAKIANPGRTIQAGSFAEVEVLTSTPVSALSVRREALKTAGDGTHYVWVLKVGEKVADKDAIYTCTMHPQVQQRGPGICPICKMELVPKDATGNVKVEKRAVKVGARDSRYVAILDGLEEGEEVTAFGDDELFPGAAVKVVEWGENGPAEVVKGTGEEPHGQGDGTGAPEKTELSQKSTMKGHEGHVHGPDDKFTCPMHPEVHKPTMGTCPICKMDLVPIVDEERP